MNIIENISRLIINTARLIAKIKARHFERISRINRNERSEKLRWDEFDEKNFAENFETIPIG